MRRKLTPFTNKTIEFLMDYLEMPLQVVLACEGHWATIERANEGLLSTVSQLVPLEMMVAFEGLSALNTLILLEADMCLIDVTGEFALLWECFTTQITY